MEMTIRELETLIQQTEAEIAYIDRHQGELRDRIRNENAKPKPDQSVLRDLENQEGTASANMARQQMALKNANDRLNDAKIEASKAKK